jgi:periplasmic protein TonB
MGVYTQTSGNWLSRRGTFLVLLIGFHVAFIFALKSGFAVKLIEKVFDPIPAEIITERKEEPPPPPPPEVTMELPPVQVPPILVDIALPPPPPTAIQAPVTTDVVPPAPPPPQVTRSVVVTKASVTYRPDTIDYYPSASISAEEQGRVRVRLCVAGNGRVTSAEIAETSGFKRLDDAGVRMAKLYRFKPGTTDGKPNDNECFVQPIVFNLKDVQ